MRVIDLREKSDITIRKYLLVLISDLLHFHLTAGGSFLYCSLWPGWSNAFIVVKPETIVGWHRAGFRLFRHIRPRSKNIGKPKIDDVLESIVERIAPNRSMFAGAFARPLNYIFVLSPDTAMQLKKRGFTGQSYQGYIIDKTSVPYEKLSEAEIEGAQKEAFGKVQNLGRNR